ncbi:hypothetical protein CDD83_899 [Cordyceps sp. RAO-2017]|nr:hypothetical protein CDD83_899 [Cordyceps sp. RAO-2017]
MRTWQCDGHRPNCGNCRDLKGQCEYRDEAPLGEESKKLAVEMIGLLNALSAQETLRTLAFLKDETDAVRIIGFLRSGGTASHQRTDASSAAAASGGFGKLELEAHNPIAYPLFTPFDPETLRTEPFRRLTESSRQAVQTSS